jgi:hypothetical protein
LTAPRKVSWFLPCFVDQLLPEVVVDTVKVSRQIGYALEFPEDQTGCGQPAFNTGCSNEAVPCAEHFVKVFKDAEMVVWPSGACGSMVRDSYPELLAASSLRKLDRNSFACVIPRLQPHRRYRENSSAGRSRPRRFVVIGQTRTQASGGLAIRLYQLANNNHPIFSQCVPRTHPAG